MTINNPQLEINIKRLLKQCEKLGRESNEQNDWRLEKVSCLTSQLGKFLKATEIENSFHFFLIVIFSM